MILTLTRRVICKRIARDPAGRMKVRPVVVPPGMYRCERIPNPLGSGETFDPNWIVLEGRTIGQSERGWARFCGPGGHVTITEEDAMSEDTMSDHECGIDCEGEAAGFRARRLPRVETQQTIRAWVDEAFPPRGPGDHQVVRDLVAVAAKVANVSGLTQAEFIACSEVAYAGMGIHWKPVPPDPGQLRRSLAGLGIFLSALADRRGVGLADAIDELMAERRLVHADSPPPDTSPDPDPVV